MNEERRSKFKLACVFVEHRRKKGASPLSSSRYQIKKTIRSFFVIIELIMKIIKKIKFSEVVSEFLKAELKSPRFSADLKSSLEHMGYSDEIVYNPDLSDKTENEKRRRVLRNYRKFLKFSPHLDWYYVDISSKELGEMYYIDYNYWNELSKNTRLVKDGAKTIEEGKSVYGVSNEGYWSALESIKNGDVIPPIIIKSVGLGKYELIEGHLRATSYMLLNSGSTIITAIAGLPRLEKLSII